MRRFLLVFLSVWLFGITSVGQDQFGHVIVSRANLRGTPSTAGKIVREVPQYESFRVIDQRPPWYLVQTDSYVGWLHGSTIKFGLPDPLLSKQPKQADQNRESGFRSPDDARLRVPDPEQVRPEILAATDDDGYDLVVSNYDGVFLRETAPDSEALGGPLPPRVKLLKRGDQMVLLSRTKTRNWVNVIDLDSGEEGWVYISHVKIYYTRNPKTSLPNFEERRTYSDQNPELQIKNDTNRTLSLRVGSARYKIEAFGSRTISVEPGSYKFYASVPRAYPLMGERYWSKGIIYSWTFFIR